MVHMFRAFRAGAGVFRQSPLPLTVQARIGRDGGAASVQGVRFRKRAMRPRYLLGTTLGLLILYNAFKRTVLAPLDKAAEDIEQSLDEDTKKEVGMTEDDNDSFFLPFPGTIKQVQERPFRGSDPEWQEYVKFSKDAKLGKRVREDLAGIARSQITENKVARAHYGKDVKIRRYWLDVDFPNGPPPSFVHSGIEITDDFVSWTTMPIDSLVVKRIQQAFYPAAVAKATWSWMKVLFSIEDPNKTAGRIVIDAHRPNGPKIELTYDELLAKTKNVTGEKIAQDKAAGDGLGVPAQVRRYNRLKAQQVQDATGKHPDAVDEKGLPAQTHGASQAKVNASQDSGDQMVATIRDTGLYKKLIARYSYANVTWKYILAMNWKPLKDLAPRGSILVSGLVELDTPAAWIVMDVMGVWDPKARMFDLDNSDFQIRRVQKKKQAPLTGS